MSVCAVISLVLTFLATTSATAWGVETVGGLLVILQVALVVVLTPLSTTTVGDVLETQRLLQAEKEVKTKRFAGEEPELLVKEVREKGEALAALPLSKAEIETEPIN